MNKVNEQIWNLLVLLKEPKRTRQPLTQFSLFLFELLFENGQFKEIKKELKSLAAPAILRMKRNENKILILFEWSGMNNGGGWVNERNEEINEIYFWMKRMSEGWLVWVGWIVVGYGPQRAQCSATKKANPTPNQQSWSKRTEWNEWSNKPNQSIKLILLIFDWLVLPVAEWMNAVGHQGNDIPAASQGSQQHQFHQFPRSWKRGIDWSWVGSRGVCLFFRNNEEWIVVGYGR